MNRFLIVAAVLVLVGCEAEAPAEKWTHIGYTADAHFLVTQPQTVGDSQRIWLASLNKADEGAGYMKTLGFYEANCTERSVRAINVSAYNADGSLMAEFSEELSRMSVGNFYYPGPDTVVYSVMEMACGRQEIVGLGFDSVNLAAKSPDLKEIEQAGAADPQ